MMKIDSNTSIETVQSYVDRFNVGQEDRYRERKQYFQKLASLHSGKNVEVTISGDQAYADLSPSSDGGYNTKINIPKKIPNMQISDYDPDVWEMLFQKVEMYHELGHILYTDWPSYKRVKKSVVDSKEKIFHEWWNIVEDAAIERLLAERFSVEKDLKIKNENLLKSTKPSRYLTLAQSISMRLMEYKHPLGWTEELEDESNHRLTFENDRTNMLYHEAAEIIEDMVPDILEMGDPEKRNENIGMLFRELEELLEESDHEDEVPETNFSFSLSDDAQNQGDGSDGMEVDMPTVDSEEGEKGESSDGGGGMSVDSEEDEEENEEGFSGLSDEEQRELEEEYEKEMQNEGSGNTEKETTESLEEWTESVKQSASRSGEDLELVVYEEEDVAYEPQRKYKESRRQSRQLSQFLEQKLRRQRRNKRQKGLQSGTINSRSLYKTKKGKSNVFHRDRKADEKDYSCIVLVDRSGSMGSGVTLMGSQDDDPDMMPEAEKAAGSLAIALEEVGVDVSVLSLFQNEVTLDKDFNEEVEQNQSKMFHGKASGGTPLNEALSIAKGRLEGHWSHPFIVVLTDGYPDYPRDYQDTLEACNFPVLGTYITENEGEHEEDGHTANASFYHKLEERQYESAYGAIRNLVKSIMF